MSVFFQVGRDSWIAENAHAFAIRDRYPVSKGHTLVITKRETPDWFSATEAERAAVFALVDEVKKQLDAELAPDGYNVGFNAGEVAGQTVMHLHVHVIPRYRGDMDDPRGGVRHVIPSKGNYLRDVRPLSTGGTGDPFARHVLPLFDTSNEIAIVAAFIQESGVVRIAPAVRAALSRGARVRIITGTYLEITQATALEMLLDWQSSHEDGGTIETRVIDVDTLPAQTKAFHPKSWRFEAKTFGIAFVGSSNLSRSALDSGVEWNLRVDRDRDREAYDRVRSAFEELWAVARPLDAAWLAQYAERAQREAESRTRPGEIEAEPLQPMPQPHDVQREALAKLAASRRDHLRRGLVVLATGLGKTWLAAFDYWQMREELGGRPRLLFVAHREELLQQAAHTFRRLLREKGEVARVSWCIGDRGDLTGELVFASVAKLSRKDQLEELRTQRFDYVVVDEVHHAAADSYRKILEAIVPRFLLGLTATPDRADARDIYGLFDDHIVYRADMGRGVALGKLAPFHYFGVKDAIDYDNIPWRNKRFDPAVLEKAVETEARMETLWRAWQEHMGSRTLIFCCSVAHASFVRTWLRARGLRVNAVFTADGSDDRESSLKELAAGTLDAVCAVDIFNEGVDVPAIDRVIMLRPTESGVVFLQQLGRGLRASPGKAAVNVIDFVGNHRVFLDRVRTLLSLGDSKAGRLGAFLNGDDETADLPAGCSVHLELEAKELLSRLYRAGGVDAVERAYRELRESEGERPTAGQLLRVGYKPTLLRERYGSWFEFVHAEKDLAEDEARVLETALLFLRDLETTEMTKCFKMVTLEAMLEADAFATGLPVRDLALRAHALLRRSPELFDDVSEEGVEEIGSANEKRWLAYWRKNPIEAWTAPKAKGRNWFRLDGERFVPAISVASELLPAFERLVRELVDLRLAQYRARKRGDAVTAEGFVCKVTWNQRDPIIKLPSRKNNDVPEGEIDVRLDDGRVWQFRFAKEFCNVARPPGTPTNQLPDLLRRWFGPRAGHPGTEFQVRFYASPDGLWVEPYRTNVVDLASRRAIVAYPDLRAAAGHAITEQEPPDAERVLLPIDSDDKHLFAVRVMGTSMDGGDAPIRDGDWAIMRLSRGSSASALVNRVILAQLAGDGGSSFQIKRLRSRDGGWALTSDNPDGPTFDVGDNVTAIARLERVVRPEDLAPAIGGTFNDEQLTEAFGLDVQTVSGRHGGHMFVFIDREGMLVAPDRVLFAPTRARPSETAFVLAKRDDGWRYLGVGRWLDDEKRWEIPEVDFATWRKWGGGREVSRRLPDGAAARAQQVVDALLRLPEKERVLDRATGGRARVLGAAQRGGVRIDGGENGFSERTVSVTDIAWVIVADDDVDTRGGVLDEERVNRLRYLEGTPKGSTRWIDSGWAIAAWNKVKDTIKEPIAGDTELRYVVRDDGQRLNATFRVERVGDRLSIVIESRGGTRGTPAERNTQYNEGLEVILARLAAAGVQLTDALVDSKATDSLPPEQRRLSLGSRGFPVAIDDPHEVRRLISAAQGKIGREPGARGSGNQTRRVRMYLAGPTEWTAERLGALLERGNA